MQRDSNTDTNAHPETQIQKRSQRTFTRQHLGFLQQNRLSTLSTLLSNLQTNCKNTSTKFVKHTDASEDGRHCDLGCPAEVSGGSARVVGVGAQDVLEAGVALHRAPLHVHASLRNAHQSPVIRRVQIRTRVLLC